ncbi:MAG: hypothetical protein JSS53_02520 [Proteobacteria bacterium]|nr:hypothetical protein [Pseudomonadota bacterium]
MTLNLEWAELSEERARLFHKECLLKEQRKQEIAHLAEQCGVLSLPNEEIFLAFQKLASRTL